MRIDLTIPGTPVAKGSARAFVVKGRAVVTQSNAARQRPWASAITLAARDAMRGRDMITGPCEVTAYFYMPRPKKHYRTGKRSAEMRLDAPWHHAGTPDLDKLLRCVLDALTGVVWRDDGQVCGIESTKTYDGKPGVSIVIRDGK